MKSTKKKITTNTLRTTIYAFCASIVSANAQTVINGGFNGLPAAGEVRYATEIGNGLYRDQSVIGGWALNRTGMVNQIRGYSDGNTLAINGSKNSATSTASQKISFANTGMFQLDFSSFSEPFVFENLAQYRVRLTASGAFAAIDPLLLFLSENTIDGEITKHSYTFEIDRAGDYELSFSNWADPNASASYQDVILDNVSIKQVPEPSSSLLIGLGLTGLFMRRNRS